MRNISFGGISLWAHDLCYKWISTGWLKSASVSIIHLVYMLFW